jgi:isopenicillin N synthase-like dioxygenase
MQTIVLNTNTALDLRLISALARELDIDMLSISNEEQEEIEDMKLLGFMQKARKEGFADKKKTLSKLGIEC